MKTEKGMQLSQVLTLLRVGKQDPQPHVSIASTIGDVCREVDAEDVERKGGALAMIEPLRVDAGEVICIIGNKIFKIPLLEAAESSLGWSRY